MLCPAVDKNLSRMSAGLASFAQRERRERRKAQAERRRAEALAAQTRRLLVALSRTAGNVAEAQRLVSTKHCTRLHGSRIQCSHALIIMPGKAMVRYHIHAYNIPLFQESLGADELLQLDMQSYAAGFVPTQQRSGGSGVCHR